MYTKQKLKTIFSDVKLSVIPKLLATFLALYGFCEAIYYFFPSLEFTHKRWLLLIILILTIGITVWKDVRKSKIGFWVGNTKVNVFFGDLFQQDGIISIPANNFLDTAVGTRVAASSLHGKFVTTIAAGEDNCDKLLKKAAIEDKDTLTRIRAKGADIGYTVCLPVSTKRYLLTVLSKTDKKNDMASSSLVYLIKALEGLLNKARECANNEILNIPLFGAGLSKVGLPPQQLLQIILIMVKKITEEQRITSEINIVLHESTFEQISLKPILEGVIDGL